ncbi:unnamed protein product [Caenorhabditis angaria]|uniref:Uncharacterized protein n=1 Tax=Caenorhabditis angaria TaxID=860376 RepID=A0A9P1IC03_9PELO|nr:unnamed protein product [Caenorhabditis angaria]
MKPLQMLLIVILTSQISTANFVEEEKEKLKIGHEFAKIFLETSIPMYIQHKVHDKLKKSLHNPLIGTKFNFKDCQGKEYDAQGFVDNYLLAGRFGEDLKMADIEAGRLSPLLRREVARTYFTTISTSRDSYRVSVTASDFQTDLEIYTIVPDCKIQYCN